MNELKKEAIEIAEIAKAYNLDFFDTIFELVTRDEMNEIIARVGFPQRYHHWIFGMEYEKFRIQTKKGGTRFFELVINSDPAYAWLARTNTLEQQKSVIAHVYGHVDFFKNNLWYEHTNRNALNELYDTHEGKVTGYSNKFGELNVEEFLDTCLSLSNLIDTTPGIRRLGDFNEEREEPVVIKPRIDYLKDWLNPEEEIKKQEEEIKLRGEEKRKKLLEGIIIPDDGERDILLFLLKYAKLEDWQKDVLAMVREEAYYFLPQRQTKIMNEGWATYWQSKIMVEALKLKESEAIDYCDTFSSILGSGGFNPYKMGLILFKNIEERWNACRYGGDYENCTDSYKKENWGRDKLEQIAKMKRYERNNTGGRRKIFQVRAAYNDLIFLEEFFTKEFCKEQSIRLVKKNEETGGQEEITSDDDFKAIKNRLLLNYTNCGMPIIRLVDYNHNNNGELYLVHLDVIDGQHIPLKNESPKKADDTLKNICKLWGKPVHLETGDQLLSAKQGNKDIIVEKRRK